MFESTRLPVRQTLQSDRPSCNLVLELGSFTAQNTPARRALNAFEQHARGAFAVRAGDVDEAQSLLWIVHQGSELECVLQAKLQAEEAQAVEKFNGFGIRRGLVLTASVAILQSLLAPQRRLCGFRGIRFAAGHAKQLPQA